MQRGEIRWYRFSSPDKKLLAFLLTQHSIMEYLVEEVRLLLPLRQKQGTTLRGFRHAEK